MPRKSRKSIQDIKIVHIVVHAIGKEYIYKEDRQKCEYINLMKKYEEEYQIEIISYCIMENHVHILLKFNEIKKLSKYMQIINTKYAIYYNKNNNRTGYVYRNRFYSEPIMNHNHLFNCIIYIHNNPIKAKMCKQVSEYKFSSYNEFMKNKYLLNKYFVNKENYEKAHKNKKCLYYFIDDDSNKQVEAKKYIDNYLKEIGKNIQDISKDEIVIKDICKTVRERYKISYKDLEKNLNISSEKIRKILMK